MEESSNVPSSKKAWKPDKCIPQTTKTPQNEIQPSSLGNKIQFMKDHAIIDKFISTWPKERDLIKWIHQWWKPKGEVDLQLGLKGFFTTIFHSIEEKERVFENGPYFYGTVGIHMKYWIEIFDPNTEDFTCVLVWIWLYSLPNEF